MKAQDLLGSGLVHLRPRAADRSELSFLPQAMARCGYDEEALARLLGVPNLFLFPFTRIPRASYFWSCAKAGSLGWMAMLWLLGQRIPRAEAEEVLTGPGVDRLARRGLLDVNEDGVYARVDLYPCGGAFVFTDRALSHPKRSNHVYELGADSYMLARMMPRWGTRVLDLCTGSGIHAIRAATWAEGCTGVDLKLRPLQFAQVNAAMNGVIDRCKFVAGSLFEPVAGERFDLVTANPPWVPAPDPTMHAYRWGGETGEELMHQVVAGLQEVLAPGGLLAMLAVYPTITGSNYVQRLRQHMSGGPWGITHVETSRVHLGEYAGLHADSPVESYDRTIYQWLDSYERQSFEAVCAGVTYVQRLPPGTPDWNVELAAEEPTSDVARYWEALLRAQRTYLDPSWQPRWDAWRPRLSSLVKHVWTNREGVGAVEFQNGFLPQLYLTSDQARLAAQCDGTRTARDLAEGQMGRTVLASLGSRCVIE